MEFCATVSIWVGTVGRPCCAVAHDRARERQEHARDLAEFWAAATPVSCGRTVQNPKWQCLLVQRVFSARIERDTTNAAATAVVEPVGEARPPGIAGFCGPEQMAGTAPALQQPLRVFGEVR